MINPSQRPLPDNTQHSRQTNILSPGRIRTHDLSSRAATDLRLRPRSHWDLHFCTIRIIISPFKWLIGRSRWPCGLRRTLNAAQLLRSQFRVLLRAWLFLSSVCCVSCRWRRLRQADHSFRGVLPAVYLLVCALEISSVRRPRPELGCCATGKRVNRSFCNESYGLFSVYTLSSRLKSDVLPHITFTQK